VHTALLYEGAWEAFKVFFASVDCQYCVNTDLGCGDVALACALIPKGHTFDLIADHVFVIEVDIFNCLPLPRSEVNSDGDEEPSQGHAQIINVSLCSVSHGYELAELHL
jgi:hypothetical protein